MAKLRRIVADLLMVGGLLSVAYGLYRLWTPYTGMILVGAASIAVSIFLVRSQIDL